MGKEYRGQLIIMKIVGQISTVEEAKEIEEIARLFTIENLIRKLLTKEK